MNRAMNQDRIFVTVLKTVNRLLPSMRRTIIDDPEHAPCFTISSVLKVACGTGY